MVNLETIAKYEDREDFIRLYFVSGDVDEVTKTTWESALVASGSNAFKYEDGSKTKAVTGDGYDRLDTSDVEDITNLSDGDMVPENALSSPVENAMVEGADAIYDEDDGDITAEDVLRVVQNMGLKDVDANQIMTIASVLRASKD